MQNVFRRKRFRVVILGDYFKDLASVLCYVVKIVIKGIDITLFYVNFAHKVFQVVPDG